MHKAAVCQIKGELECRKKEMKAILKEVQQEYDSKFTLIFIYFILVILYPCIWSYFSM